MRAPAPFLRRLRRLPVCVWQTSASSSFIFDIRITGIVVFLYAVLIVLLLRCYSPTDDFYTGRLLHLLYYYVVCVLALLEAACSHFYIGHSTLRTMWLSAPVLV